MEEQVRRYERSRDDQGVSRKLDADIKILALEMFVLRDIEKRLTLYKYEYRLKPLDDAMQEITFISEARTASRFKEPSGKMP